MSPYVKQNVRKVLDNGVTPGNQGELNYVISTLVISYVKRRGLSYQTINDIMGALVGALLEFYMRVARPYEDKKIQDNGDVYQDILPPLP